MAQLTPQTIDPQGSVVTFAAAAAGGDTVTHESNLVLIARNAAAATAAMTVTIASKATAQLGYAPANNAVSVPIGGEAMIPLSPGVYRDAASGNVSITYSTATNVTVAVIRHR